MANRLTGRSAAPRGFDPHAIPYRRARRSLRGLFRRLLVGAGLAAAVTFGGATAAFATEGFIVSTKSVAAPTGFHGVCQRYSWACATGTPTADGPGAAETLRLAARVNSLVNRQVREVSDQRQYRRAEVWALPTRRGGDCEDFALLKKRELIRLGIPPENLLIATVLTKKRTAHAVLVLRTDAGDFVLDNLTSRIKPWHKTGYAFLRMQDPRAPGRWQAILAGGLFETRGRANGA